LTESTCPLVAEAIAQIREKLAAGTPCMVLSAPSGAGKSAILGALLAQPPASVGSLRSDIAVLDYARHELASADAERPVPFAIEFGTSATTVALYIGSPPFRTVTVPAAASITPPESLPDRPWSPSPELSFPLIGSPLSSQLIPIDPARYTLSGTEELVLLVRRHNRASFAVAISEALVPDLRQGLLRLIDGARAILRLILIRVLSALAHPPDVINVALVLLAASRCFGHRSDPSDHTLPVLTSMSVVTGRLPACVS
jgi:hypothetical protein